MENTSPIVQPGDPGDYATEAPQDPVIPDLLPRINGMYRLLDIVSENATGGDVDKIVIDEHGTKAFVNSLLPGAYKSVSSVDFKALDDHRLQLVGIYGSKAEIARFLLANGHIDQKTAADMEKPHAQQHIVQTGSSLRSGLYLLHDAQTSVPDNGHRVYVIFWPEDTTWSNHPTSAAKKNRVAFMRYLTKLTDQLLVFVSQEHANSIIWSDTRIEADAATMTGDDDDDDEDDDHDTQFSSDRIFAFSVKETAEHEEDVTMRPGFEIHHPSITMPTYIDDVVDPAILAPRLTLGETAQGLLTAIIQPATIATHPFDERCRALVLKDQIKVSPAIRIGPDIDEHGIKILVDLGLDKKAPEACAAWQHARSAALKAYAEAQSASSAEIQERLSVGENELASTLRAVIRSRIVRLYPTSESLAKCMFDLFPDSSAPDAEAKWDSLCSLYPECRTILAKQLEAQSFDTFTKPTSFIRAKCCLITAQWVWGAHPQMAREQRETIVQRMLQGGQPVAEPGWSFKSHWNAAVKTILSWANRAEDAQDELKRVVNDAKQVPDRQFIASLSVLVTQHSQPLFAEAATNLINQWRQIMRERYDNAIRDTLDEIAVVQKTTLNERAAEKHISELDIALCTARQAFSQALVEATPQKGVSGSIITYTSVRPVETHGHRNNYGQDAQYLLTGKKTAETPSSVRYTVQPFSLSEGDEQDLHVNARHVPQPLLNLRLKSSFVLPLDSSIRHIQLLPKKKCLVIIATTEALFIYVVALADLGPAVSQGRFKIKINSERIGKEFVLGFDEGKRSMAILAMLNREYILHIYECDESFSRIRPRPGNPFNLTKWFANNPRIIRHLCFVGGNDTHTTALCLVDNANHVCIYSLTSGQLLPASVTLHRTPIFLSSTPDGSCLCAVGRTENDEFLLETHHWASFGSAEAHEIDLPLTESTTMHTLSMTSFIDSNCVHIVAIQLERSACQSYALDISKKVTEFALKASDNSQLATVPSAMPSTNALIECLSDVWTRFPVVSAITRATITSGRAPLRITFVTEQDHHRYAAHFAESIRSFEKTSCKPTGERLAAITVDAIPFSTLVGQALAKTPLSCLHAGEWLIEAMCLIPIQIAVTRENRFVPLKDGVWSAELERSLLGATVKMVANSISLGWYESIFSYPPYVHRPVKVVSSMGEQSVGKSYSINHLVDTSFAGSAMRCTEGVWMSCTPTKDTLIVSLDFEGVRSIERSAQEDNLLVLFNTAISNMILFRNNFALSRDIAGLFTSFQSASTGMLDPTTNKSLFQSILIIIIKDVIEGDRLDMAREFQLKFSRIVNEEQAQNFLSRLHGGKTNIIPWPVIQSEQFYKLFDQLRKILRRQKISHPTAGGFLQKLKTLMAMIKTHDWIALDQNLALQRVEQVQQQLVSAFVYGLGAPPPNDFPLKNMDEETVIVADDTDDVFYFASQSLDLPEEPEKQQADLASLCTSVRTKPARQMIPDNEWVDLVSTELRSRLSKRLKHVTEWVNINIVRFDRHEEIKQLRKTFESAAREFQASVEFCRSTCGLGRPSCMLLCLLPHGHKSPHHCATNHLCKFRCEILDGHDDDENEPCGHPAGHSGIHVCNVSAHLCAKACAGTGHPGCLNACSKSIQHDDDGHLCAGRHACGAPCDLRGLRLADGSSFSCPDTCILPWDVDHSQHKCDLQTCPLPCSLCKTTISTCSGSHFHGQLDTDATHLCSDGHNCESLCAADGICEISSVPRAIESTFAGRHEVYQYTKYSQDARRCACAIRIPAGRLTHDGKHTHTTDKNVSHFCTTRCPMCDYFCNLPFGHSQAEHETSHGSMSKTHWALEGTNESMVEVGGHKFAANETGAPMLCGSVCQSQGPHVHLDYCCAATAGECIGKGIEHLSMRISPDVDRPKDAVSHAVFWKRTGFKDPYSQAHQTEFALCDHMCCGDEHKSSPGYTARPSYCTQPIFHAPVQQSAQTSGYVSSDGHTFDCANPARAYHVIFVIDRSISMSSNKQQPLTNTPVYNDIRRVADNRLGAVYSSLYGFWTARDAAVGASSVQNSHRRDSYSLIFFNGNPETCLENDFTSTPRQLLDLLLTRSAGGGTNFNRALEAAQALMEKHWRADQQPVVIFLSDGECSLDNQIMFTLCHRALALGKPLAFHSVSFGDDSRASSLRRMVEIGQQIYSTAPPTVMGNESGANNRTQCTFSNARNSVKLTEAFLGIAESMRKPLASLMCT